MKVLVTDIEFNNGSPITVLLPHYYCYEQMAQQYLRAYLFDKVEITYGFTVLQEKHGRYYTEKPVGQPFDINVVDDTAHLLDEHSFEYEVTPFHIEKLIIDIDDETLKYADNDIEQAIFEVLELVLPVSFMYEKTE